MDRKLLPRVIALAAFAVLATAALARAQDISYTALPGTDFTKYKTYKWIRIEGAKPLDSITDSMLRQSIEAQLAKKGLTKIEDDNADLYIGYQAAIDEERQWSSYSSGGYMWGYGGMYPYGGYAGGGITTTTSELIRIGTLTIDIYDRAKTQLVWKGGATKTLDSKTTPEKRQKNIDKATEKLFKKYPPPVKK
jgi:hypothetical protein